MTLRLETSPAGAVGGAGLGAAVGEGRICPVRCCALAGTALEATIKNEAIDNTNFEVAILDP
jgi:hypothetical protein